MLSVCHLLAMAEQAPLVVEMGEWVMSDHYRAPTKSLALPEVAKSRDVLAGLQPTRRFLAAAHAGDVATVAALLDANLPGLNVHERNEQAFRWAASAGHTELLALLLALSGEQEVEVGAEGFAALIKAAGAGHLDVVNVLLALEGARAVPAGEHLDEAFQAAVAQGHLPVIRRLLALRGTLAVRPGAQRSRALREAAQGGHTAVVVELLALPLTRGVDVHAERCEAFRMAALLNHTAVATELMALRGRRAMPPWVEQLYVDGAPAAVLATNAAWGHCALTPHRRVAVLHRTEWRTRRFPSAARLRATAAAAAQASV